MVGEKPPSVSMSVTFTTRRSSAASREGVSLLGGAALEVGRELRCRVVVHGATQDLAVVEKERGDVGFAEPAGVCQHRLEDRAEVGG